MAGFADLETTFQYQLLKDAPHELALLLGLDRGLGEVPGPPMRVQKSSYGTLTPTVYFGRASATCPARWAGFVLFALTGTGHG